MYYNIHTKQLLDSYPESIILSNGTVVTGSNFDSNILINAGYYPVKNDIPAKPENSYEDVSQRQITIENDGVIVNRVWTTKPQTVPSNISARQVRLWLIDNDISLTGVEAAIDTIVNEKLREKTRVEWEYAPYLERYHPLIETIGAYLNLSPQQIDEAFIKASKL